jgi:predicted ATPase
VLDNAEHLLAAFPAIAALLSRCPELKLLVTSRALLRLSGEHEYPVAPLALPAPTQLRPSMGQAHSRPTCSRRSPAPPQRDHGPWREAHAAVTLQDTRAEGRLDIAITFRRQTQAARSSHRVTGSWFPILRPCVAFRSDVCPALLAMAAVCRCRHGAAKLWHAPPTFRVTDH